VARNRGQAVRQESGEYDKIVEQHLLKFWQAQENGVTPAAQPAGGDGGPRKEKVRRALVPGMRRRRTMGSPRR
jgi:hypothetical protein